MDLRKTRAHGNGAAGANNEPFAAPAPGWRPRDRREPGAPGTKVSMIFMYGMHIIVCTV